MERVIVFGLGRDFEYYKSTILHKFEVIACTDNFVIPEVEFWRNKYIFPQDISNYDYDKILICTRKYRDAVKVQLVKYGILINKILYLDSLDKRDIQSDFEKVILDMETYQAYNTDDKFNITEENLWLISDDKNKSAGIPCPHYFAQDIWGGKKIYHNNPKIHYDIGSRLDGFIAHLLVFREVNYIDIRPLPYVIPGLHFVQGDATKLDGFENETIESLSCFHALEHFGLGRYGDEVVPEAYKRAAENMQRVLKKDGHLYIGVPIGPIDKLVFNAHRIFSIPTVLSLFNEMTLLEIAIVEPDGVFAREMGEQNYKDVKEFSCGLFEFIKKC